MPSAPTMQQHRHRQCRAQRPDPPWRQTISHEIGSLMFVTSAGRPAYLIARGRMDHVHRYRFCQQQRRLGNLQQVEFQRFDGSLQGRHWSKTLFRRVNPLTTLTSRFRAQGRQQRPLWRTTAIPWKLPGLLTEVARKKVLQWKDAQGTGRLVSLFQQGRHKGQWPASSKASVLV